MARAKKSMNGASVEAAPQAGGCAQHPAVSTKPPKKRKSKGKKKDTAGKKTGGPKPAKKGGVRGSGKQARDVRQHPQGGQEGAPNFAYMGRSPAAAVSATNLQPVRVYWDAENIPFHPMWHAAVVQALAGYGRVTALEVFASGQCASDLTRPPKHGFRPPGATLHTVLDSGVNPKNKTDMTLALEALAAVFQHPDSLFLIVSDDKDFEPLVLKLQSRGAVASVATKRGQDTCSYTAVADHWIDLHAALPPGTSRHGPRLPDADAPPPAPPPVAPTNGAGPSTAATEWLAVRARPSHSGRSVPPDRVTEPAAGRVTFACTAAAAALHAEAPAPPPSQNGGATGRHGHCPGNSQPGVSQAENPGGLQQQRQDPSGRKRKRGAESSDPAAEDQPPRPTKNHAPKSRKKLHVSPPTEAQPPVPEHIVPQTAAAGGRITRSGRRYGRRVN